MRPRIITIFGAAALQLLLLTPVGAQGKQETGLSGPPIFAEKLKGDFVVAGASTRIFEGPPQADPFNLTIAGIPAGSTIEKAFLDWNYSTNDVNAAANQTVRIDDNAYAGNLVGQGTPDLGWGLKNGASYLADVTEEVMRKGGNGVYSVSDIVDNATPSLGEGASLLIVYSNPKSFERQIDVYGGYTSTYSGNAEANLRFFSTTDPTQGMTPYSGGKAHFFTNALDGQKRFTNDWYVNGQLASGTLGTGPKNHAWLGRLGPGPVGTNLFDHAQGDARRFMNVGDTNLTYETIGYDNGIRKNYSDVVGHSFAAISFQVVPEGSTFTTLALCLAPLMAAVWRRRRQRRRPIENSLR